MKKYLIDVKYILLLVVMIVVAPFVWKATSNEVIMFRVGMLSLNIAIIVSIAYHYWLTVIKHRL